MAQRNAPLLAAAERNKDQYIAPSAAPAIERVNSNNNRYIEAYIFFFVLVEVNLSYFAPPRQLTYRS